ncbi:MAG: hypothetical protein AAFR81_07335 [Chloroflexota bacterium]
MATQTQTMQTRKQVRGFVLIWTFLTLLMGGATFLAIYFAYDPQLQASLPAVPNNSGDGNSVVVIASQTALPATDVPTAIPSPTEDESAAATAEEESAVAEEAVAVAQVATEALPTPSPTPEPTAVPPDEDERFQVGIQVQVPPDFNGDVMEGWYRSVQQMNIQWVKIQVRWQDVEPEQGEYFWDGLDLAMRLALFYQKRPILSVVTAPDWSRTTGREAGISLDRLGPPSNNSDYVEFVRTIIQRYPGQVFGVEVWNEQNLDREWTSMQGLSATNYVSLLRDTYNMIDEESPGTIVISGALSPTGIDDGIGAINDFRYMQQMIDAGMLDVTDCVGVHHNGYNIGPLVRFDEVPNDPSAIFRGPFDNPHHSWSFRSTLEGYATRIRNAGYDTKMCVTEFGWAVSEDLGAYPPGFEFAQDNTLEEQATYFVEALEYMSSGDDVWLAIVWNLNYGPQAGWDTNNDNTPYSLIGPDFNFRPAYDAIRDWVGAYRAETFGE